MTDHAFRVRDLSSILAQYDGSVPTHRKGAESSAVASASIRHVSAVGDLEPGRRPGAGGGLKAATPPAAGRRSSRAPGGSGLGEPHERRARCVNACTRAQPRACMHWCPPLLLAPPSRFSLNVRSVASRPPATSSRLSCHLGCGFDPLSWRLLGWAARLPAAPSCHQPLFFPR